LAGHAYEYLDDPEPVLAGLRSCGYRIDLFTFLERLPVTTPRFMYLMEWDNLAVVPVCTFDNWWNSQIRPEARNRARQALKKGVTVRVVPFDDVLVKGIWEIYNECPVRAGRRFPHYGKDAETVYAEEATFLQSSAFIGAFLNDKLIGFVKLVWDQTQTQANLMNILSMVRHRDKAPTNALIAEAVRYCAEKKIAYLVYQRFSYGKKQCDGLTKFKEVNGFVRVNVPRYYIPLSQIGKMALHLGLHHRFADHLPEAFLGRLRQLRTAWYGRKTLLAKESPNE
jgi:hypothetical protein